MAGQYTREEASQKLVDYINALAKDGSLEAWFRQRKTLSLTRLSLFNQLAIYSQAHAYGIDPTLVNGAKTWKREFGRSVKGPEWQRKLFYYAPVFRYWSVDEKDEDTGETVTRKGKTLVGFTVVYGFDVTQTTGKALPEAAEWKPQYTATGDDAWQNWDALVAYAEAQGCTVGVCAARHGEDGCYSPMTDEIRITETLEPNGKVAALIHETCHAIGFKRHEQGKKAYAEAEIVTETAAFLVADALGFDIAKEASEYIVWWANANVETALTFLAEADRMANDMLAALLPASVPASVPA